MSNITKEDMPSDLFFILNFSIGFIVSFIAIIINLTIIIIVIIHQKCHTIANLLVCNSSIALIFYLILAMYASIYGLREDWAWNPPLCIFRAYCFIVAIGSVCYSFSIQSLSRLFCTIYYTNKSLQSWNIHYVMIFINWLISFLIPIVPLLDKGSLGLEKVSRGCVLKSNAFLSSIFCMIIVITIPLCITLIVYTKIYYRSRQSTSRILHYFPIIHHHHSRRQNITRELKIVQHLFIHMTCGACGGIIFLFNVFWQALVDISLPKSMFLFGYNSMTMGISLMTIAHFIVNKRIKKLTIRYIKRRCGSV